MGKNALRLKNMTAPKQQGELARLRVLGGPDSGSVYILKSSYVSIGRGEENDIILGDINASRKHAEILLAQGSASLRDLGSAQGTMVNGVPQKNAVLRNGDKLGFGTTVIELLLSGQQGNTQMLSNNPLRVVSSVGTGQSGLTQFMSKPQAPASSAFGSVSSGGSNEGFYERNKKLIFALAVLLFIATLLPQVEERQRAKKNKYLDPKNFELERTMRELAPSQLDAQAIKNAEHYFREGFREYRAKNYLRAQIAFETALQIYADHPLARTYLENTHKAMETEAEEHKKAAKRDEESNRLVGALNHFEAIKRLYNREQTNDNYKEAVTRIDELRKKIKESEAL